MKRIIFIFTTVSLLISCSKTNKEVILSYPDGKPNLVYYTQGDGADKVLVAEENLYQNGNIRYRKDYKNGQPTGTWKFYYENGKTFAEADFSNNEFGDNWKFFAEDGSILAEAKDSIHISEMNTDRSPMTIVVGSNKYQQTEYQFFKNYKLRSKGNLNEGQRDGKWTAWYENGNPQSECAYVYGTPNGEQTVYYENGNIRYKGSYHNGQRIGEWQFFDENGNLLTSPKF